MEETSEISRPWWYENRWPLAVVAGLVVLLLPPAAFMARAWYVMETPAIPYPKMERLHVGMAAAEVRDLLGDPGSVLEREDGGEEWKYCPGTWAMYSIAFDADGRITDHYHDY